MPKLHLDCDVVKGKRKRKPRKKRASTPRSRFIQAQKAEVARCVAAVKKEAQNGKELIKDAIKSKDPGLAKKLIAAFGGAAAAVAQSPELRNLVIEQGGALITQQLQALADIRIPF